MSRVVVIGATGHVGTYLVPRLVRAGHEVIAMSRGLQMNRDTGPTVIKRERSLSAPAAASLPPS